MKFEVTILGSSSATPIFNRNPSSQTLNINDRLYLIDCGEGTQQQMLRFGVKASRIDNIFISHLHGDHYLGLVGLLSSLHLNGRTKPLNLFAPFQLKEIIDIQLKYSETELQYEINYVDTDPAKPALIFENQDITVETIPLYHRIPTTGFLFKQKNRNRKLLKDKAEELNIPVEYYTALKKGQNYVAPDGKVYKNSDLTVAPEAPKTYAYCSDTIYSEQYFKQISGVDLLYHESTFLNDMLERAQSTFHTTALQAGHVALKTSVKKLALGHFSARYKTLDDLLAEAQTVFPNSELAIEGKTFVIE
jgi:ribonuclease Z